MTESGQPTQDVGSGDLGPRITRHRDGMDDLDALLLEVNGLAIRARRLTRKQLVHNDLPIRCKSVLQAVHRSGAQTVPQIARLNSTSRQNIQVLVNRLKKEGCIEVVPNPAHRRSSLVRLTEQGRAALSVMLQ